MAGALSPVLSQVKCPVLLTPRVTLAEAQVLCVLAHLVASPFRAGPEGRPA